MGSHADLVAMGIPRLADDTNNLLVTAGKTSPAVDRVSTKSSRGVACLRNLSRGVNV